MWSDDAIIYQIYPLGMCGAPFENDGRCKHRLLKVSSFIPHMKKLGVNTVLFNPLFESDTHGYNTRDYGHCDIRLGTDADLKKVMDDLHDNGFRVLFDGVFNHVGRGFYQFQDVLKNRENSPYKDWFYINMDGNSEFNDGLWYEGWEGYYDLVKLNLDNPEVSDFLLNHVKSWIEEYDIDGLRLDVAYMVNREFLKRLRKETSGWKKDFWLYGEMLHGDYREIMNDYMCHSVTNYECYKGLYSAFNSKNLFEIMHSLLRQFGKEEWCLYTGMQLGSFVDNHDVSRIATMLEDKSKLFLIYTFLFAMPGIPSVYYGSEWGIEGDKVAGDQALRPEIAKPKWEPLCDHIAALCKARKNSKALTKGDFSSLVLENEHCIFERCFEDERILAVFNISNEPYTFHADFKAGRATDILTGTQVDFGGGLNVPGYTAYILR